MRTATALAELFDNDDLRDVNADHRWIGPSRDSADGLGTCSCGDDDCDVAVVLDVLAKVQTLFLAVPADAVPACCADEGGAWCVITTGLDHCMTGTEGRADAVPDAERDDFDREDATALAEELAGSGSYDFSSPLEGWTPAYRPYMVRQAGRLLEALLIALPNWRRRAADAVPDAERLTRLLVEARVDVQRCRNCGHDHGWHDLRLGFGWCAWGAPEEPCDCAGWGGNGPLLERIDAALAAPSEP